METKNEPLFTLNMEQAHKYRDMLIQQYREISQLPKDHKEYFIKQTDKEIQRVNEWMARNGC